MILYLVRHGQTDGSREGRYCGAIDIPLNATGLAMAQALAVYYAHDSWAAIYSSPLQRARMTADPLSKRTGLLPEIEPGLREIEYGEWEGLLPDEARAKNPELYAKWDADPGNFAPPGGETGKQVAERAVKAIENIRARHSDGQVLAVAHKATIRVLVCALMGIDISQFRARIAQPVGCVTVIEFKKSGPMLKKLGDNCHLPPELRKEEGT
jgi:probable phosphoglycerate mutase